VKAVAEAAIAAEMPTLAQSVWVKQPRAHLVGISRAITDFSYCCYLSDLAVDAAFQQQGIGKRLIEETHKAAGDMTSLILVAAPAAETYYPKIGMQAVKSAWMFPRQG
jgi:predicted N-acetyltransferase YhbS